MAVNGGGFTRTLEPEAVKVMWAVAFWDGPINGICLFEDRIHWFEMITEEHEPGRTFAIFDMPDEAVRIEVEQHLLFEQLVGVHGCFHSTADGRRPDAGPWGNEVRRDEYYKLDRVRFSPSAAQQPVGIWCPYGVTCVACNGTGYDGDRDCGICDGAGAVPIGHGHG